jgi:nucleotide-binding universal stress UspA family protein
VYQKILLPLDGSPTANAALPHAIEMAKATGAEIVLLQVVDSVGRIIAQTTPAGFEPISTGHAVTDVAEQAVNAQRQVAEEYLGQVRAELEAADVSGVSIRITDGSPGAAICAAAEQLGCDLVVMATHGRSGFGRAILGSVADHVVRHTHQYAVLLVRPDTEE